MYVSGDEFSSKMTVKTLVNPTCHVLAHFTCSSVLSALVFDGILYFIWPFWLFMTKSCAPKKSINLKELNHKWNELRHDSHVSNVFTVILELNSSPDTYIFWLISVCQSYMTVVKKLESMVHCTN